MKESGHNNTTKDEKSGNDFPNPLDVDELGHMLDDPTSSEDRQDPMTYTETK